MAFGQSRRQAFLDAVAPSYDDEPNYEPGLRLVQQLLGDAKKAADLVDRAVKATATIKSSKAALDELEAAKVRATADIDKAKQEIDRLYAAHQAKVAKELQLVEADRKGAAQARAAAEADAAKGQVLQGRTDQTPAGSRACGVWPMSLCSGEEQRAQRESALAALRRRLPATRRETSCARY
jgi:hypothetical protein